MMRNWFNSLMVSVLFITNLQAQCLDGDCQNGKGTFLFDGGSKYIGAFANSMMNGKGKVTLPNGNVYDGDWLANTREGIGTYIYANGNTYIGTFKKNRIAGEGTMLFAAGHRYIGAWESDMPSGQGKYFFKNGERYEGSFKAGKFDGQGTMYYPSGESRSGVWVNNLLGGEVKITQADGSTEMTLWENGVQLANPVVNNLKVKDCNSEYCKAGRGQFMYSDGSRYVGGFVEGQPEGEGICYYVNGDRYEGKWAKHAPHGEGVMYYTTGRVLGAIWEYGQPKGNLASKDKGVSLNPVKVDKDPAVKIWAIVVGVSRYTSMQMLKYSDDDAYQYYAFLKSPEGGALPDGQVKVLIDEDATRLNILNAMRQTLLRADENDVIVFYFSGHGLEGSFLPIDYDGFNNKVLHSEVRAIMEESQAKHKICFADACHSGSLLAFKGQKQGLQNVLQNYYSAFNESSGGLALFMSSKSEEFSLEDQGLRSGVFSHFLIKGLKGEADADRNKIVTVKELADYVTKNVMRYTAGAQTPMLSGKHDENMPVAVQR
jgi:hypothetical protein